MSEHVRDLSITLLGCDESDPDQEFGMYAYKCKCGTACSVCSGTGTKPCHKNIDDEDFARLRDLVARI